MTSKLFSGILLWFEMWSRQMVMLVVQKLKLLLAGRPLTTWRQLVTTYVIWWLVASTGQHRKVGRRKHNDDVLVLTCLFVGDGLLCPCGQLVVVLFSFSLYGLIWFSLIWGNFFLSYITIEEKHTKWILLTCKWSISAVTSSLYIIKTLKWLISFIRYSF
jgi:fatty acid desaturase